MIQRPWTISVRLHEAVLSRRWRKAVIDDRDLIPLPGDNSFDHLEKTLEQHGTKQKTAGHGVNALLATIRPGCYPANYVQELLFDFRMLRYSAPEFMQICQKPSGYTPVVSWLQYNLKLLDPHLINIRTLKYDGEVLPQSTLDELAGLKNVWQIQNLELQRRSGPLWGLGLSRRSWMDPASRPLLSFDSLGKFSHLESLAIHRLAHFEVSSFCKLLPAFSRLKTLLIEDERADWRVVPGGSNGCGIRMFLEYLLYGPEETSEEQTPASINHSVLPSTLTTLTLRDNHDCLRWVRYALVSFVTLILARPVEAVPRTLMTIDAPLINPSVDIDGLRYLPKLAACFSNAKLQTLAVPGSIFPYQEPNYFHELHNLISAHHDTLKQIKIFQAWDSSQEFAQNFHNRWKDKFAIEELVLGTRNHNWTFSPRRDWFDIPSPMLRQHLDAFDTGQMIPRIMENGVIDLNA